MAGYDEPVEAGSLGGWVTPSDARGATASEPTTAPATDADDLSGVHVYELADEFHLTSAEALDVCDRAGLAADSGATRLSPADAERFRAEAGRPPVAPDPFGEADPAPDEGVAPPPATEWSYRTGPPQPEPGAPTIGGFSDGTQHFAPGSPFAQPLVTGGSAPSGGASSDEPPDTSNAKTDKLAILAFVLCFLPGLKLLASGHLGFFPSTIVSMILMAPTWTLADKAEEHIIDEPEKYKGETLCLWAKALASLFLLIAIAIGFVRWLI